jgi:predicted transglutaminase-like cysteine proteinase
MTMDFSRRGTLFGLLAFAGTAPATPGLAEAFDYAFADDVSAAPGCLPALFGARERVIGKPGQLFPEAPEPPKVAKRVLTTWRDMLDNLMPFKAKGQVAGVNSYVNCFGDVTPLAARAKKGRWAAPASYIRTDEVSEDAALAKFASLRYLGFHPDRLKIVWFEDQQEKSRHALLAVALADQAAILEHRFSDVTTDIMLPAYRPYCSLSETQFSLHWDPTEGKKVMASLDRLGKSLRGTGALAAAA